ncbi:hypothetical protein AGMMS49975_17500 [Clostridia bacterium]|nr:hypothetical protein AGMMS49975_17500 [Clostridia bacterium]GHU74431.1 hypothetical protein FACS1894188_02630 [Clostridia bacterium]
MLLLDSVKVGDRLEIKISREEDFAKAHASQVEDILPKDEIVLSAPISYGQIVKLSKEEDYDLTFFTSGGMIQFPAKFLLFTKEENFYFARFKITGDGKRAQRREFFRFNCLIDFKFAEIPEVEYPIWENITDEKRAVMFEALEDSMTKYDGLIKDIGAGGVRFVSNDNVDEGALVNAIIPLRDQQFVAVGRLLRKQYFPKSVYRYQYRIQFTGMSSREQEKIVQFIFTEQRKSLKRE